MRGSAAPRTTPSRMASIAYVITLSVIATGCGDSAVAPAPTPSLHIQPLASTTLFVGDAVHVRAELQPVAAAEIVWRSSNTGVVRVGPDGQLRAIAPGSIVLTATSQGLSDRVAIDVLDLPALYSAQAVEYFGEVAFGTEEGTAIGVLRKWVAPPRVRVFGDATPADHAALDRVISDLNGLLPDLGLELASQTGTIEIHFVPVEEFSRLVPTYTEGNLGYFWVWWNGAQEITRARVLIASDGIEQEERDHLLREEVTQVLGLMQDSWSYPESIFYQGWTDTDGFAEIDRMLIQMLYRPDLRPGQPRDQVLERLTSARLSRSDAARLAGR